MVTDSLKDLTSWIWVCHDYRIAGDEVSPQAQKENHCGLSDQINLANYYRTLVKTSQKRWVTLLRVASIDHPWKSLET